MKNIILITLCSLLLLHSPASADKITSTVLESGSVSWDSGTFSYPDGEPEISIQKITIKTDGEEVALPVPLVGIKGTL